MFTSVHTITRGGCTLECLVPEGLALGALQGGTKLEVKFKVAEGGNEGHDTEAKSLPVAGDGEGDNHGRLSFFFLGHGSGELGRDLGEGVEAEVGGLNLCSDLFAGRDGNALEGRDVGEKQFAPTGDVVDGGGREAYVREG